MRNINTYCNNTIARKLNIAYVYKMFRVRNFVEQIHAILEGISFQPFNYHTMAL